MIAAHSSIDTGEWGIARAICQIDWDCLRDYPFRVPVPHEFCDEPAEWVRARFAGRTDRPLTALGVGNWLIYAFRDKVDAAMFRLLFGDAA